MVEVRIRGVTLFIQAPHLLEDNIASFDCSVGPVVVTGAKLRRFKTGVVLAVMPQCRERNCGFRFSDHRVQTAVTEAAITAYVAAGGVLPADDV